MKNENVVKKVAVLIVFVLVTSGTAFGAAISPSTSTAEYWAVIVGGNSLYAHHDAADMYNALNMTSENWDAGHIRFLVNENATKANIRDAIQWMANEASPEDTCIFYFTGHGKNCRDLNGDEIDGLDESISTFYNEAILDDELEEWLDEVKARKKVAILDACYSGGVLTPHQIEYEASDTFDLDGFARDLEKANCMVLAACQVNESSSDVDILNNGIFTYYIVQGMWGAADEDDDARISVRELYDYSYTKTVEFQEIVWNQEEEPQQPLLWPEDDTAKNIYLITLKKSVTKEIKVPDDYRTIQEAVEAAMPGDIIEVSTGFYKENVIINKPLAVNAPHQDSVIQAADTSLPCMLITVDNTSISGLSCQKGSYGIWLLKSNNCCISNCSCSNNEYFGISLASSEKNRLSHNNCSNNEQYGILLYDSRNNSLSHSTCLNNEEYGMVLYNSYSSSVSHSTCLNNDRHGIVLNSSCNNCVTNSTCLNNKHSGIILDEYSCNNNITNSICSDNGHHGFVLVDYSCNNRISNSICSDNEQFGIGLTYSDNNRLFNSTCSDNKLSGIFLEFSGNNSITNSTCSNNKYRGIELDYSDNNSLFNSTCSNNEEDGFSISYSSNNRISIVNSSNNEEYGIELDSSVNNSILNSTCLDNEVGIILFYSSNNRIISSTCYNNESGIILKSSTNNTLTGNTANLNKQYHGIELTASNNNGIVDNNASNNFQCGIALFESSNNNTITDNRANSNDIGGIQVDYSNNNAIIRNTASNNENGIVLYSSKCNTLRNNLMYGNRYNFGTDGNSNYDLNNDIDTSNLVDGKPIYYLVGASGTIINSSSNAGTVHCINCDSITIKDLNLTNNFIGIGFYNTSNSNIQNNNCSSNLIGIALAESRDNTITSNTARNNNHRGIGIVDSTSNKIYYNNFINNTDNVYSRDSTNIWNSTEEITYTYSGFTYTNHMGNYWSDYTDIDSDSNGIRANPYIIDSDRDYQPLVMPWDNYIVQPKNVLDTGQPENPYPSIMGNHTGTIKTNHTIIATKLYTYPCEDTGGHTEYAKIWNATWDATATWEGYGSDWNNIVFNKPVVLLANETYNYTIRTGSYPQIHHNKILTLPDGEFTCLKFTDTNGKVYYDMIPAIRLFQ